MYEFSGKYDLYVIIIANLIYKTIIGKFVLLRRHAYEADTTVFFPGGLGRGAGGSKNNLYFSGVSTLEALVL